MSKININPNAGGTGTLTVTSPNTNTDYTLTLPSGTGTFNISGTPNEVPAGTASAPSIYFSGDTNTGIYSPGSDTIAFTEGGVESMRLDSSGNLLVGTTSASTPSSTGFISTANTFGFKNRIINGRMEIDQRNVGASVTPAAGAYTLDRWTASMSQTSKFSVQRNAGSVTPPAGYINYLGATSLSAYTVGSGEVFALSQCIEGLNCADLAWGSASAKTVTLSFWVRSSLTGTFGGVVTNSAQNRAYPFSYSISSANTWEYKTVTITGDTSGTWLTTNATGIVIRFSLGAGSTYSGTAGAWAGTQLWSVTGATSVVGTNGATLYITGVQLETGTAATSFDYRSYGTEVQLCQRYYCKNSDIDVAPANGASYLTSGAFLTTSSSAFTTNGIYLPWISLPTTMRAVPTTINFINTNLPTSPTAGNWSRYNGTAWVNSVLGIQSSTATGFGLTSQDTGMTANTTYLFYGAWNASAEL